MSDRPPIASFARSTHPDPRQAARELADRLGPEPCAAVVFFAAPRDSFADLAAEMQGVIDGPTIGCTTAGELCGTLGHSEQGVVAAAIRTPHLELRATLVRDAATLEPARAAREIGSLLPPADTHHSTLDGRSFGLTLIDGLTMAEERIASTVADALAGMPFAGGSAGDDLRFARTQVACGGEAASDAAVVAVATTDHPFQVFQSNHFEATDERLVITAADPASRRVHEIDAEPAAIAFARRVGRDVADLSPQDFADNPLLLKVGGNYHVRSIQRADPDHSLVFYCAIDEGLVLRIGRGGHLPSHLERELERIREELGGISLLIGFDCILRRLQLEGRGQCAAVRDILATIPLIGFSTYGEQYNGLHVNQTITGVALGPAA